MSEIVYLNGQFVPAADAKVSVFDGGWLHGAGLFETMRAHQGKIFRLDAHLDRLMNSSAKLLLPVERPDLPLTKDFERLLAENSLRDARVRLTLTAGSMRGEAQGDRPAMTVCATVAPRSPHPPEVYQAGMAVKISTFTQSPADPLAGHKSIGYLPRLLALREAQRHRCGEALWFTPERQLAEGSISNVFIVKAGTLRTPPLDTPVLPGITRAVVLEIAHREGVEAREAPININELLDADEVFLTNSGMEIMPVIRVEKRDIASGRPGPLVQKMLSWYRDVLRDECGS